MTTLDDQPGGRDRPAPFTAAATFDPDHYFGQLRDDLDPGLDEDQAPETIGDINAVEPRPIQLVDLVQLARDGIPPPTFIADGYLYAGQVHSLAGPPDCGKSTLALWWLLQELRAGRTVLLLDEEGGRASVVEKLLDLGAQPDELAGLRYAEFPGRAWDAHDLLALAQLVDEAQPSIIAFDSMAAFMARAGREENDARDVTTFASEVLLPLAREHGAAVLYLDHVTKDGNGGRYARGSGAKLASVDVAYTLDLVTPFSRNESGLVKLIVTKDRRGYLHRKHDMAVLAAQPLRLQFTRDDKTSSSGPVALAGFRTAARKLLAALAAAHQRSQDPASTTRAQLTVPETVDLVKELFGHGLNWDNSKGDLNALLRAELVDKVEGVGRQRAVWFATLAGLDAAAQDPIGRAEE
jgi:AAA domain